MSEHPPPAGNEGSPPKPSKHWQPPTAAELHVMLPQYEITRLLGRGGMGAVYQGTQIELQRPVAIKILPPDLEEDNTANYVERFKNEARSMAKLSHPGIVTVHDFGATVAGLLYFVMEFVEGTDVSRMIAREGRLHTAHALAITAHVCDALHYAHERGVVHRDIKPANIIVSNEGVVKVADFGLAKMNVGGETAGLTRTGMAMGTLHYMAPETLMLGAEADRRADIYAVGAMLFHMLTGRLPHGMFELPSLQIPGLDPRLDSIIAKAMREDRELRYQTAAEMRLDLDSILTRPVVIAEPDAEKALPALPPPTSAADEVEEPAPSEWHASTIQPSALNHPSESPRGTAALLKAAATLMLGAAGAWLFLKQPWKAEEAPVPSAAPAPTVASTAPVPNIPTPTPTTAPSAPVVQTAQAPSPAPVPVVSSAPPPAQPAAVMPAPAPKMVPEQPQPSQVATLLAKLVQDFQLTTEHGIETAHQAKVAVLNQNYLKALDRALVTPPVPAELAQALREERQRIETDGKLPEEATDRLLPVASPLRNLRLTYRNTLGQYNAAKALALRPHYDAYVKALEELLAERSQAGNDADAARVKAVRDEAAKKRDALMPVVASNVGVPAPAAAATAVPKPGPLGKTHTNSLGMKFAAVNGTKVLFCIHETRRRDWAAYAAANPGLNENWRSPPNSMPLAHEEDHPVIFINYADIQGFCTWLSNQEGRTYRLPTDREWSYAVGIGTREAKADIPELLNQKIAKEYPWGSKWPPPDRVVNLAGSDPAERVPGLNPIPDFTDGFPTTAPVMSFPPNRAGLHDLGGNVWEMCEDWFDSLRTRRTTRGGSWGDQGVGTLLSSGRGQAGPADRQSAVGFRVVLETTP